MWSHGHEPPGLPAGSTSLRGRVRGWGTARAYRKPTFFYGVRKRQSDIANAYENRRTGT